jgi:hypothetical protein
MFPGKPLASKRFSSITLMILTNCEPRSLFHLLHIQFHATGSTTRTRSQAGSVRSFATKTHLHHSSHGMCRGGHLELGYDGVVSSIVSFTVPHV